MYREAGYTGHRNAFITCKIGTGSSITLMLFMFFFFFFFDLRGVSGPAYAHHDYSPRPAGHPASPGAGKAPRG